MTIDNPTQKSSPKAVSIFQNAFRKVKNFDFFGNNASLSSVQIYSSKDLSPYLSEKHSPIDLDNPLTAFNHSFQLLHSNSEITPALIVEPILISKRHASLIKSISQESFKKTVKFAFPSEIRYPVVISDLLDLSSPLKQSKFYQTNESFFSISSIEGSLDSINSDGTVPCYPSDMNAQSIEHYYIQWCNTTQSNPIDKLIQDIRNYKSTHFLIDISNCTIDRDNFIPLIRILDLETGLSELCLSDCGLNDDLCKQIFNSLSKSKIKFLDISNNVNIESTGIKQLSKFISSNPFLTNLNLNGCPLNKKSLSYLSYALGHQSGNLITSASLKNLSLVQCYIKSTSLSSLSLGVKLSRLERLCLGHNVKIGDNLLALNELLMTPSLKYLDLRACDLGESVKPFMHQLIQQNTIEYIDLRGNSLRSDALASISTFMMKCNSLKCIDLSNNLLCHPDNYGIESLKNMLLVNTSITQIIMNNCDLNVHACIEMADVLSMNTSLKVIHLSHNPIELAGVFALSAAMKINTSISDLEILPVFDALKESYIESEELGEMMAIISMHLENNKQSTLKSMPPHQSSHKMERENIDAAFTVSQVLCDMIEPGLCMIRSESLGEMVDELYEQCKAYDLAIKQMDVDSKQNNEILALTKRLKDTLSLYEHQKSPPNIPEETSASQVNQEKGEFMIAPVLVDERFKFFEEPLEEAKKSVITGLFKADSTFSMTSVDRVLEGFEKGDKEVDLNDIDAFLKESLK